MTEVDWCFSQNFRHLSSYGIVIAKLCVSYLGNYYRLRSVLGSKFFVSDVWYPNRGTWRGIKSLPPCSNFPQLVSPLHIYYTTLALIAKPSTTYISLIKMVQIKLSIAFVIAAAAIAPVVSQPIGERAEALEAREPHHHRYHHHHHRHHRAEAPPAEASGGE